MAKLSTNKAHELVASNWTRVDEEGETYGVRVALRSDGALLYRARWFIGYDGKRQNANSSYSHWKQLTPEATERARKGEARQIVERVMQRRGFTPEA